MLRRLVFVLLCTFAAAQIPMVRVGLDTSQNEYLFSFEGGGVIQSIQGVPIRSFSNGERFRIWWDNESPGKSIDEYRIQVKGPLSAYDADQLITQLKTQGFDTDKVAVVDSDFFRVLSGRFPTFKKAEIDFDKLKTLGYEELWISNERNMDLPKPGKGLYLVTDHYERVPLPIQGVSLKPSGLITQVLGKGKYRGRIELLPHNSGRLSVINIVDLETYLRGVVPREMGPSEFPDLEALKAQAVAARTYGLANLGKRTNEGFDLNDTISDQVYGGFEAEQQMTDRAVEETRGIIASYKGKPIQALFMANAGGSTIDVREVFGGEAPYLKGVSTYSTDAPMLMFASASHYSQILPSMLTEAQFKLLISGLLPPESLSKEKLNSAVISSDAQLLLSKIRARFNLDLEVTAQEDFTILSVARKLGFDRLIVGQDRLSDASYMFGSLVDPKDMPLAYFLLRRNLASYEDLTLTKNPDWKTYINWIYLFWNELEPLQIQEGTLLRTGQVRKKKEEPKNINLDKDTVFAIEIPGGYYQLVSSLSIPAGDRLRWIANDQGRVMFAVHRKDPDGVSSERFHPAAHWKQEYTESELLALVTRRIPLKGIHSIELKHNPQGRVIQMTIRDENKSSYTFTGMRIRNLLSLKDNVFSFVSIGKSAQRRWVFYGRGWGHGVGLSQTGAYGMAIEGKKFDQILKYFYTNIQLTTLY